MAAPHANSPLGYREGFFKDYTDRRDLVLKRRRQFLPVLEALGLAEVFHRLPQGLRHRILSKKFSPVRVEVDPSVHRSVAGVELVAALRRALDRPSVDVLGDGRLVSLNDYQSYLFPFQGILWIAKRDGRLPAAAAPAGPLLQPSVYEFMARWTEALEDELVSVTAKHSRLDEQLFWAELLISPLQSDFKADYVIRLRAEQPRRRQFHVDGESRPAFQCGGWPGGGQFVWVEWPPQLLGIDAPATLPVYIQSHAIRRMAERLLTPDDRGVVHPVLTFSLMYPEIVETDGRSFRAACRVNPGTRLGYLVGDVVDGKALVRTFLFLTMEGTPEAELLRQRLGARRGDIERLRLDELDTFLESDLGDDEELAAIFASCGCGKLLELRKLLDSEACKRGYAQEVRRYLRIPDSPARAALLARG